MAPVTEPRPPDHPLSLTDLDTGELSDREVALLGRVAVATIAAGGYGVTPEARLGDTEAAELGRTILKAIAAGGGN